MNQCYYCRKEIGPGARACVECQDYAMAARVALRVVEEADLGGPVAASVSAEIVREFLFRSVSGARARQTSSPAGEEHARRRPLI